MDRYVYGGTNMNFKMIVKKIVFFFTVLLTTVMSVIPVKAQSFFTKEEQEYINSRGTIKAVSIDGVAPLQYYDANGQVKGIARNVLDTISELTGLNFSYKLYNSIDEIMSSDADIYFGVSKKNQLKNIHLSIPSAFRHQSFTKSMDIRKCLTSLNTHTPVQDTTL